MSLLNQKLKNGFYFLRSQRDEVSHIFPHEKTHRNDTLIWLIRTWDDRDYYYCEIFQGNAFKIFPIDTIVPEPVLNKIKNDDKTFLYICNTHEAFLDIVQPIYESLVLEAGIPPNKIYISNEAADLEKEVRKYADANKLEYFNVDWILEFEYSMSIQANQFKLDGSTILQDRQYNKRYLNFNRRWRLHRPTLVAFLQAKGLLDKGFVSLGPSDDNRNWESIWPWIVRFHESDPELHGLLCTHEKEILRLPPLYLDTHELVNNRALLEEQSLFLYENSLVSVVTETTFYHGAGLNEARFLSEKIFKPIAVGHPFIFVTVPKSLELLRSLGYKTFHPFIDESYDNEFDDCTRLKLILKEIEKISNYSDKEVSEFIKNVKGICDYNQQLLKSKSLDFMIGNDPDCKILHSNFVKKTL